MIHVSPSIVYPIAIALPLFVVTILLLVRLRRWRRGEPTVDFDYASAEPAEYEPVEDLTPSEPRSDDGRRGIKERFATSVYPYKRRQ